ncbi:hypothetical protein ACTXT7_011601 [Hymenolepis weldensis]
MLRASSAGSSGESHDQYSKKKTSMESSNVDPHLKGIRAKKREVQGCKVYMNVHRKVSNELSMGSLFLSCNDQELKLKHGISECYPQRSH